MEPSCSRGRRGNFLKGSPASMPNDDTLVSSGFPVGSGWTSSPRNADGGRAPFVRPRSFLGDEQASSASLSFPCCERVREWPRISLFGLRFGAGRTGAEASVGELAVEAVGDVGVVRRLRTRLNADILSHTSRSIDGLGCFSAYGLWWERIGVDGDDVEGVFGELLPDVT